MRRIFLSLPLLFFSFSLIQSQQAFIGKKELYYGASFYPEAWDINNIEQDIARMKELKMNVMRMAEFSWSLMEPTEGNYQFQWLHEIIEKLHENGIDVILGTPTATPPAWLGTKYPEIYVTEENGLKTTHGARRNCNYTSRVYRDYSQKIVRKMAEEFGKKPGVIGWQTDNEFNLIYDYSSETQEHWMHWLQDRYKNIENLNKRWCTNLWSQTYNAFSEIPMPRSNVWHHPSLRMAWYRFSSDMIVEFQDIQVNAIREYSSLPVTHDGMPGQKQDYEKLFEKLDYMAVNNYHSFEAYNRIQSNYDRMRGYNKGMFWLFETAPNYSGGGDKGNTWFLHQPDGSLFAALLMNYAMGGQGAMYWLWKQHWAGHEMVHGSVISAWNKPAANYHEIKSLGETLATYSSLLMDYAVEKPEIAMFWSHENMMGLSIEEYANGLNYYTDWTYRFYRPVSDAYLHRDVIGVNAAIDEYKILLAPMMPFIPDELKSKLMPWVEQGGILILGPMSGYRSEEWTSYTNHALGDFGLWSGIAIESRIPVGISRRPAEIPLYLNFKDIIDYPDSVEAGLWSEALSSANGKIIADYHNGMHDNKPAIIENNVGKGTVVYLGTDPGKKAYAALVSHYASKAGILPLASGDEDVVVVPRKNGKERILFIINLKNEESNIQLKGDNFEDITGKPQVIPAGFTLSPFEYKIIRHKE